MLDINLEIITLLEGERKVDEPIHKTDYFKELKEESLNNVIKFFNGKLKSKKYSLCICKMAFHL